MGSSLCVDAEREEDPPLTYEMLGKSEQKDLPIWKSFT